MTFTENLFIILAVIIFVIFLNVRTEKKHLEMQMETKEHAVIVLQFVLSNKMAIKNLNDIH